MGNWRGKSMIVEEEIEIDEKPPDPGGVLGGKPTPELESQGVLLLDFFDKAVGRWWPRFRLMLRGQAVGDRAIVCQAIVGRDY